MRKWLKENDIPIKTLSLLVAILLWFYVMDSQDPDMTQPFYDVEVQYTGLSNLSDAGLIITEGNTATVDIRITGKLSDLLGFSRTDIRATVDVSSITVPGEYERTYLVTLTNNRLTYTRVTQRVTFTVDRVATRSIPVQIAIQGEPAEGYVLGGHSLTPEAVTVEGPEQVLAQIDHAAAVYDVSGATSSVNTVLDYTLVNEAGDPIDMTFITLEQPTVDFELQVHQSGEIPLTVDIVPYGYITDDMIDCHIEPESIRISGDPEVVSTTNQINLGSISIRQLLEDNVTELTMPIILPNGVTTDSEYSYATITISFKNLRQMVVNTTSEQFADISPYTYAETGLSLVFMGTDEELSLLTAEDVLITPVYNPDNLEVGENTVSVTVSTGDRQVTLIGSYTLTIIVPEEPPTDPDLPTDPDNPDGNETVPDDPGTTTNPDDPGALE